MKERIILVLAFIAFNLSVHSQIEIQTQKLPEEIELGYSYIVEDGSVVKARARGENIVFTKFDSNMNLTDKDVKVKFTFDTKNGKNYYQYMELIGENIYVFAKQHDDKNKIVNVIVQAINTHNFEIEIEPKVIFSYPLLAGFWSDADYGVNDFLYEISENKEYILFSHYVASDQKEKFNKAYKLFDKDLTHYWSKAQSDVYSTGSINNFSTVSDNGITIINKRLYHRDADGTFLKQTNNFSVYNIEGEEVKEISILEDEYSIGNISIDFSNDKNIYFSGVYFIDKWDTDFHEGIASWIYNYESNELSEIIYTEIPEDIITKYYSEKQKKKYLKTRHKFTVTSTFYRQFYVRNVIYNSTGTYVLVDKNLIGQFDGLLVLFYDKKNDLQWIKQLPKFKRAKSDYEFAPFFYPYLKDDILHILYTDKYENAISPKIEPGETEIGQNSLIHATVDKTGEALFSNILSFSKNDNFDILLQKYNVYKYGNDISFFSKKGSEIKVHKIEMN